MYIYTDIKVYLSVIFTIDINLNVYVLTIAIRLIELI